MILHYSPLASCRIIVLRYGVVVVRDNWEAAAERAFELAKSMEELEGEGGL